MLTYDFVIDIVIDIFGKPLYRNIKIIEIEF